MAARAAPGDRTATAAAQDRKRRLALAVPLGGNTAESLAGPRSALCAACGRRGLDLEAAGLEPPSPGPGSARVGSADGPLARPRGSWC